MRRWASGAGLAVLLGAVAAWAGTAAVPEGKAKVPDTA